MLRDLIGRGGENFRQLPFILSAREITTEDTGDTEVTSNVLALFLGFGSRLP